MSGGEENSDLLSHYQILVKKRQRGVDAAQMVRVVDAIMATMNGQVPDARSKVHDEIEALARYIAEAKAEIASLRPDEIRDEHLPVATDELEAIVGSTEQATNGILAAVETIESLAAAMPPETAAKVTDAVTVIYEACGFQDITGQRIAKVVKALQHIETKVDALLVAFGDDIQRYKKAVPARRPAMAATDADLLNGPQLPNDAAKQAEIDALFASFDSPAR